MMKKKIFRKFYALIGCVCTISFITSITTPIAVFAENKPIVQARSAILYDVNTGKILYGKDEHKKMYPASMTKILTALIVLEYFELDEFIVAGDEVNNYPPGSSTAGNIENETIRIDNLIRLIIIPSGNETACVAAMAVAKRALNNETVTYVNAEKWFCETMNEKAKELGALGTHFVNPHGFHDPNHYSTAYDIALIAHEAMKNDFIRQVVGETVFRGNAAGENPDPTWTTKEYNLKSHNELINGSEFSYGYATGIKTGRMNESGDCVAASATKGDRSLIAIIMFSQDPGRWTDSATLFEYGFNNFKYENIQTAADVTGTIAVSNPQLGAPDTIEYTAYGEKGDLLSKEQVSKITQIITFDTELIADPVVDEETGKTDDTEKLKTPIEEGQVIGRVDYLLNGESIFFDDLVAVQSAAERTFNSDVDYYLKIAKEKATSPLAVPIYTGIVVLIGIIIKIVLSVKKRQNRHSYRIRKRY